MPLTATRRRSHTASEGLWGPDVCPPREPQDRARQASQTAAHVHTHTQFAHCTPTYTPEAVTSPPAQFLPGRPLQSPGPDQLPFHGCGRPGQDALGARPSGARPQLQSSAAERRRVRVERRSRTARRRAGGGRASSRARLVLLRFLARHRAALFPNRWQRGPAWLGLPVREPNVAESGLDHPVEEPSGDPGRQEGYFTPVGPAESISGL